MNSAHSLTSKHHLKKSENVDIELVHARQEVERSRAEMERALNHLEEKLEDTLEKAELMVYRLKAPMRAARRYPDSNFGVWLVAKFWVGLYWAGSSSDVRISKSKFDLE